MTDHDTKETESEPKDAVKWLEIAQKQHADAAYQEAIMSASKALEINPKLKAAWSLLEDMYNHTGEKKRAENAGRKALELDAEFTKLSRHFRVGAIDAAYPESSRTDTVKALEIDPLCAEAWFFLSKLHINLPGLSGISVAAEDYKKALEVCGKAVEIDPGHARAWGRMGRLYLDQENNEKAIELINKALEISPDSADSWCLLSEAYLSGGDNDAALHACSKAVSLNRRNFEAWAQKGAVHFVLKQYSEAARAYRSSLQIESLQPQVRYMLAVTYENWGQFNKAIEVYREAIECETNAANKQLFLHKTGLLYSRNKQHSKAIEFFQRALAINREDSELWHNLGASYYENGQFKKAVQALKKALKINSGSKPTRNLLDKVKKHIKMTPGQSS